MEFDSGMHSLGLTLQVFFLDLLLSGDNAIVIALACRKLPPQQMRQAIMMGTGVAIGLRILFTTMVTFLLAIPFLKLLGMLALIWIAIKLLVEEDNDPELAHLDESDQDGSLSVPTSLWATIGVIVVADVTMSLDNVVALAAIAQNSVFYLVLGLLLSVPLLMYGSLFVTRLLKRYPILIPAGAALLGWIAGDIGMSDPLIADWINAQLPGLTLAMPLACAIFVLLESSIIQKNLRRFPKPTPERRVPRPESTQETSSVQEITPDLPELPVSLAAAALPEQVETTVATIDQTPATPFLSKKTIYLLVGLLTLPIPVVIGTIIYKSVVNHGLMPPPTQLNRYECPGMQGSFDFYFRHGIETVRIQSSSGKLQGIAHNGKIGWVHFSGDTAVLGFTPPQEITWDDANTVRLNGGSFLQINCTKKSSTPAAP